MSIESHVAKLEKRHMALEREIEDCEQRPAVDPVKVTELKRKKLLLKDEIERFRTADPKKTSLH